MAACAPTHFRYTVAVCVWCLAWNPGNHLPRFATYNSLGHGRERAYSILDIKNVANIYRPHPNAVGESSESLRVILPKHVFSPNKKAALRQPKFHKMLWNYSTSTGILSNLSVLRLITSSLPSRTRLIAS